MIWHAFRKGLLKVLAGRLIAGGTSLATSRPRVFGPRSAPDGRSGETDATVGALLAPFAPGQPDDDRIEDRQGAEPECVQRASGTISSLVEMARTTASVRELTPAPACCDRVEEPRRNDVEARRTRGSREVLPAWSRADWRAQRINSAAAAASATSEAEPNMTNGPWAVVLWIPRSGKSSCRPAV